MMEINGPVVGGARGGGIYQNLPPTFSDEASLEKSPTPMDYFIIITTI